MKERMKELAKELGYSWEVVAQLRVIDVAALLELRRAMRGRVVS